VRFRPAAELTAGLDEVRNSPTGEGRVELVVRRPTVDGREVLTEGILDPEVGLVGDTWKERPSSRTPDRSAHPAMQVTVMNARAAALVAGTIDRWPLAGDQIYVDLDISESALPVGSLVEVGSAVIEVSDQPHTGCAKFSARFGPDAMKVFNSPEGQALRLRGLNARVISGGIVRPGDTIRALA
jgi:MOSC domain-containing protein YiiM